MMLDKKQSQAIFLLKFKMGQNAAEQLTSSATHMAQELLRNGQAVAAQGVLQKR